MKSSFLLFLLVAVLTFNRCDDKPDPDPIRFNFTLVDQNGADLFFNESSSYTLSDIIFGYNQSFDQVLEEWFDIVDSSYFQLDNFYPKINESYEFHIQFFPNSIDTIIIADSEFIESKNNLYSFDVSFNSKIIYSGTNSNEITKITIND